VESDPPYVRRSEEPVTVEKIIAGYQQLIDRAHLHGIKVIAAP
jgi:hypothetical protein